MSTVQKLQDTGFAPERLRELRIRSSKSQSQMASQLGSPKSSYVSWETGTASPSVALYDAIAAGFGVETLFYVMGLTDNLESRSSPIDKAAGSDLAIAVEECFKRVGLNYDAGDVFEMAVSLLELPEDARPHRLEGIESGLLKAREAGQKKI